MSDTVSAVWELVYKTLAAMSDVYVKIKVGIATQAEKNGFLAQGNAVALHSEQLIKELNELPDSAKAGALSRFHDDLAGLLSGELKNAKSLCRNIVRQFLRIANFHLLHGEGDQDLWMPLQEKFQTMFDGLPIE